MSELTPCNYCTMKRIAAEHPGAKVSVRADTITGTSPGGYHGWLRLYIDDEPYGVAFQELTLECVC